jgi:hypothetical protein
MGLLILLVIVVAFTAAALRQEAGLALTGAVFFLPWFYSLVMTLILALIHKRRAGRACIRITPRETAAGGQAEAVYSEGDTGAQAGRILQLPGILVRCRLLLATKDGRRIAHDFNPSDSAQSPHFFTVKKRGAYFSAYDEFAVFDVFGFFRFAFLLLAGTNARLLASPGAAQEPVAVHARAGESNQKPEFSFQRTDNLIDHRPYIPGDDPRRINWKLYGHGGGLFVREGEREPPPHSNIVIMTDCEYDPSLYNLMEARRGIDVLCENAQAAAQACMESGMDVLIGYTGVGAFDAAGSDTPLLLPAKQTASLAWPAAVPLSASPELPPAPDDYSILILALPRSASNTSLERFLKKTSVRRAGKSNTVDLIFFCDNSDECLTAAETCCTLYRQRPGVTARVIRE